MASVLRFDEWQDVDGVKRGTIVQVQSVFDNNFYTFNAGSVNQTTFYDISGLTLTITPKSASNKILLLAHVGASQPGNAYNNYLRFVRNGSAIASCQASVLYRSGATATAGCRTVDSVEVTSVPMTYLDSPNTTAAVTYKIQCCNSGGPSYPSYINRAATTDTSWVQPCTSNFMALEIQA